MKAAAECSLFFSTQRGTESLHALDDVVKPVVAERFNDALTGAAALGELPHQAEGRDEH